jgi:serine/threonine-protein kinase
VAVKVLRSEMAADETARRRFEREAKSAASLTHPNVVPVYRFGRLSNGVPYLVMRYVAGRTLADRLQALGPMTETDTRALLHQLASALAAAHRKGIVHRDVCPANVLVDEETGRFLLSDFGMAALLETGAGIGERLTVAGQIIGEPRYASPEQLRDEPVTGQADIYSLGVLAYEVLTGERPYRASSLKEILEAQVTAEPRPLSSLGVTVAPDLEALLLRCLARQPAHRPRAGDLVAGLEAPIAGAGERNPTQREDAIDEGLGIMRRRIPHIVSVTFAAGVGLLALVMDAIGINRLPDIAFDFTVNFVVWTILAAAVLAWFHGEKGRQQTTPTEKWILGALGVGWLVVTVLLYLRR